MTNEVPRATLEEEIRRRMYDKDLRS